MFIRLDEIEIRIKDVKDVLELLDDLKSEMQLEGSDEFEPDENYHMQIQDAAQEMNSLVGYLLQIL